MDKGAHFRKCDFQVHTPRDLGWVGKDAITDEERIAYADELIQACRAKGLGAIAITDHHDFAFFPYIRKAAQNELDVNGKSVPQDQQITVFPGIELTLTAPNCQALLLLDADFPENLLASVLTALSITPASHSDSKHASVQRIPQNVVKDLSDLYEKLNSHAHLNDRFIVLPNVSETGHGTMLRAGFGNFYKAMPCVGGYTDGPVSKFGKGNLSIVNGKNRDYGFKAIAIFQTSDNRTRAHTDLGNYSTWVKWSEPTSEALRQACLAKESRLSQEDPQLPNLWITSVSVSNSKFLGRIELELNQQYNAVIGGRGTGKSTILEYIRWGLCDQPIEDGGMDIVQEKRKNLIDNTLQKFDGDVHVTFLLNGIQHIVKRSSKKQEILLKIADSEFQIATEEQIRNLLLIQAYSQKQLSSVSVRIDELKRFVELPIQKELDELRSSVRDAEAKLRVSYGRYIRKKEIETEIEKDAVELESLAKQLEGLRKGLKGLSAEDQEVISQKPKYDNEQTIIEQLRNKLDTTKERIQVVTDGFDIAIDGQDDDLELQNPTVITDIKSRVESKYQEIKKALDELDRLFDEKSLRSINDAMQEWDKLKIIFDRKYEDAKSNAKANQQQITHIQVIEKRIAALKKGQLEKRNALSSLGDPEKTYKTQRQMWDELHSKKMSALDRQCLQFTTLSNGLIKAHIKNSLDTDKLSQKFKAAFAGMNIKEEKIDKLCDHLLKSQTPVAEWNGILDDLEKLALHSMQGPDSLPNTPVLNKCSIIENERKRIATSFDSNKWVELSVTELEFNPQFLYCTSKEKDEYIDFVEASAGQQATALLTVLLNQEGAPLIIDQPEDDIDSKMIKDIVEQIWKAKSKRQLIFASHNANFVVNGDAELVVCCDYVRAGDQMNGRIKSVGAIDNREIKDEITLVTEGGKEAFKLRMEKYGF